MGLTGEELGELGQLPEEIHRQNGGVLMDLSTGTIPQNLMFDREYVAIPVAGETSKSWVYPAETNFQKLLNSNGVNNNGQSLLTQINDIVADYDQKLKPVAVKVLQNDIWTPSEQSFSFDLLAERQKKLEEALKYNPIGAPSLGESMIPVWGSGRAALNDFQRAVNNWGQPDNINQWGSAAFNTAMLGADLATAGSLVRPVTNMGTNVAMKYGSRMFPELIKENPVRVTQFYQTAKEFADDAKKAGQTFVNPQRDYKALNTPEVTSWNKNGEKLVDGPWIGRSQPKSYVSPYKAVDMNNIDRGLSGVGERTHYVEFDAFPGELNSGEGTKFFQHYIPGEVNLIKRKPVFGTMDKVSGYQWVPQAVIPSSYSTIGHSWIYPHTFKMQNEE